MKVTTIKRCYCHKCEKPFHYLGITAHRAMHRRKREDCEITYTHGDTYIHAYSQPNRHKVTPKGWAKMQPVEQTA